MKRKSKEPNQSGRITVENDTVRYVSPVYGTWELSLSEVKVIGEYTNSDGPHLDDYFFVFVLHDGSWRQASFYADGRVSFLDELSQKFGFRVACGLEDSTSLKSRVLWPEALRGEILFTFARAPAPKNPFARILDKFSPSFLFELSEPIRKALNR